MSAIEDSLKGSIYSLDPAGSHALVEMFESIDSRVTLLRSTGKLSAETLRRYYGAKRFEQVAESNAIEGSTLSVGETELAIVKGVTLTGHDPGYARDAIALDRALTRLTEMARVPEPTDIKQLKELHELILEGRPSAGCFRSTPVRISGSSHRPPETWREVMCAMEEWEEWSRVHALQPPALRASILHAWLSHIHPFADGNGRTARAVTNLELVRAGYPPVIIRRKQDRGQYINALQTSDEAGDIGPFLDLMLTRLDAALVGLEGAAREVEGYDPVVARLRQSQERKLVVWNRSVDLFYVILVDKLTEKVEPLGGKVESEVYSDSLLLDDYLVLCQGRPISRSWAFRVRVSVPGVGAVERLAWVGYRSQPLRAATGEPGTFAPSLFWSRRSPSSFPPWVSAEMDAPGLRELSVTPSEGDEWHVLDVTGDYRRLSTVQAAEAAVLGFAEIVVQ